MNEKTLVFEEQDETGATTGRSLKLTGFEFLPLGYTDLASARLHDKVVVPLRLKNAKVVSSTFPDIHEGHTTTIRTTLESSLTSKGIALVNGGWLPSGLAISSGMIVMPDRCIISELRGRFGGGRKQIDKEDFLDYFSAADICINPLLYAVEGNTRTNPTREIVARQVAEVYDALRTALPQAQLVPSDDDGIEGAIGVIHDTAKGIENKQRFLVRLAPKIHAPVKASRKDALWNEILREARECDVPKNSLVVIAALSAISISNGGSPAKRLLKLKQGFDDQDAYNALADLRSLELLMCFFSLFPTERVMLCTADKNLALFWAGIRASNFIWHDGHLQYRLSPVEALLPNVTASPCIVTQVDGECAGQLPATSVLDGTAARSRDRGRRTRSRSQPASL